MAPVINPGRVVYAPQRRLAETTESAPPLEPHRTCPSVTSAKPWRRLRLGLQTLIAPWLGLPPRGVFVPYRHAATVRPSRYPAVEQRFQAAMPVFLEQLSSLHSWAEDLHRIGRTPAESPPPEPRWGQGWLPPLDAAMAYAMVRAHRPRHIVEVGSGHSTRFLARAVRDGGLTTQITCIDPQPRADIDRLDVARIAAPVETLDPVALPALAAGDMLFIDSSHVALPGTDVDVLFTTVLPQVPPGTLVHVHDVFLPDPYPAAWQWRAYNEQGVVAAWILAGGLTPLFASHFVASRVRAALDSSPVGPLLTADLEGGFIGTSFWGVRADP